MPLLDADGRPWRRVIGFLPEYRVDRETLAGDIELVDAIASESITSDSEEEEEDEL